MTYTVEAAEKAVQWLIDHAEDIAAARAERVKREEMLKPIRSVIMAQYADKPVGVQEREALAHPKYAEAVDALAEAVKRDETNRALVKAAELKVEVWRSMQANLRATRV